MKRFRQSAILDLIDREPISSQELLRRRLRARGLEATQATLSRDIKELGLVKRAADGAYQRPGPPPEADADADTSRVARAVADYLLRFDRVQQLVVLKTDPGEAQPLAWAIDHSALPEVVGTIGGDDTILVIARDPARARALVKRFERWIRR
jgi:transcriptional regulator of arginine metabolism